MSPSKRKGWPKSRKSAPAQNKTALTPAKPQATPEADGRAGRGAEGEAEAEELFFDAASPDKDPPALHERMRDASSTQGDGREPAASRLSATAGGLEADFDEFVEASEVGRVEHSTKEGEGEDYGQMSAEDLLEIIKQRIARLPSAPASALAPVAQLVSRYKGQCEELLLRYPRLCRSPRETAGLRTALGAMHK